MKPKKAVIAKKRGGNMATQEIEISKRTIMVLLILTVLISVFGTLTMLNALEMKSVALPARPAEKGRTLSSEAQVTVDIAPLVTGTGRVILDIAK